MPDGKIYCQEVTVRGMEYFAKDIDINDFEKIKSVERESHISLVNKTDAYWGEGKVVKIGDIEALLDRRRDELSSSSSSTSFSSSSSTTPKAIKGE